MKQFRSAAIISGYNRIQEGIAAPDFQSGASPRMLAAVLPLHIWRGKILELATAFANEVILEKDMSPCAEN